MKGGSGGSPDSGVAIGVRERRQPDGIRVTVLLPGGVDTEMVALSRPDLDRDSLMAPADVAQAVRYLLSLSPRCCVDQLALRRPGAAPF